MAEATEVYADDLPRPRGHFAHAVSAGGWVFVSGLLALDADGKIVSPGDAAAQTERICAALDSILAAAGSSKEQVVRLNIYVTDVADRTVVGSVRAEYFGEHRPASTLVEISALAADGAVVEIDAVATAIEGQG